jgi:protein-S-isoprenylcysteine O-methyltransferase Ste14
MSLLLKNLLFTLVVPASVGIYGPLLLTRGSSPKLGLTVPLALVFFAIGTVLYLWSLWNFATRGRGTPLPLDAPKKLVIHGPYQYVRNPMYVGLLAALMGWVLLFQSAILIVYALIGLVAVNLFVVVYEEPHLRDLFGVDYEAYRARVPRWFPRFRRQPRA